MQRWIEQCAREELEGETIATGSQTGTADEEARDRRRRRSSAPAHSAATPIRKVAASSRCCSYRQAERRLAGVLALQVPPGVRTIPPRALRAEIASQLFEHGDVDGQGPRTESED